MSSHDTGDCTPRRERWPKQIVFSPDTEAASVTSTDAFKVVERNSIIEHPDLAVLNNVG
jgi:hypothetical protein